MRTIWGVESTNVDHDSCFVKSQVISKKTKEDEEERNKCVDAINFVDAPCVCSELSGLIFFFSFST